MRPQAWLFRAIVTMVVVLAISTAERISAQAVLLPHNVQGSGAQSPHLGASVTVRGVVIARTADGFFMQTEAGSEDDDPATSEGLFVAGVIDAALLGHAVTVFGVVQESNSRTQLQPMAPVQDLGAATLPAATALTDAEISPTGTRDQLERFEGMRVTAELTTMSPTALDGSFFAVAGFVSRPFREPGIEAGAPALPCASAPCDFATFDGNPERIRVDTDGVVGVSALDLAVEAFLIPTGPLDFAAGHYTLLPEVDPMSFGGIPPSEAPAAAADQYTVASMSLGWPGTDTASQERRLEKASRVVRWMMGLPDVIALQRAESETVVQALAERINSESPEAGYVALLDGFLVRGSRVTVTSVEHLATTIFARRPVMLRAIVSGGAFAKRLTIINSEFRSLADVAANSLAGQQARAERLAQADWLAGYVDTRQDSNPRESILVVGNFNAHAFNDGYVDVVGTVRGTPAPANSVVLASAPVVAPALVDLTATMWDGQRYSSIVDGNSQALDHMLASANLAEQFQSVAYARVNADFPESLAVVDGELRLSDRDPVVAYFSFPGDEEPPVFDVLPGNREAAATSPAGAAVSYTLPSATDNADPSVAVTCAPLSGAVFPVGETVVTCRAEDDAGNQASASFTVTVTPMASSLRGKMTGGGTVGDNKRLVAFAFDVRDTARGEKGWLVLLSKYNGRKHTFVATTIDITFSNADGYSPGRFPANGLDTVAFSGVGYWNGMPNYRFEATASDRGESRKSRDTFSVVIRSPSGRVVESITGVLRDGNVQARR